MGDMVTVTSDVTAPFVDVCSSTLMVVPAETSSTVTVHCADAPSQDTVTMAVPAASAMTLPSASTCRTVSSDTVHTNLVEQMDVIHIEKPRPA